MKIRAKLGLAVAIPAAGLIAIGGARVASNWRHVDELAHVQTLADYGVRVSGLIHETQKERGATAGFLGSQGKKFGERLAKQRQLTDEQLGLYREFLATCNTCSHGVEFSAAVERTTDLLKSLAETRSAVDRLAIPAPQAIAYYTGVNASLLDATGKASAATSVGEITTRIVAYNAFLKSKERAGIERAVLSNTFAQDRFGPGMYEKFTVLVALQDAYLDEFLAIATPEDRELFAETLDKTCVNEVNGFREIAVAKARDGSFGVDAGVWFDTITNKINLLKQVDDELASRLKSHTRRLANGAATQLGWTLAFVPVAIGAAAFIAFTAVRSILKGLASVAARVRDIAEGEGDLTRRLVVTHDELGEVARWFNAFMDKLEITVRSIAQSATQLNTDSADLVTTAGSLEQGADTSRAQAGTIAAATEEMSSTITQIAESTDRLSEGMESVSSSIGEVSGSIEEVASRSSESSEVTQNVKATVKLSGDRIRELGDAATEIDSVVALIEDVAEQTNLLALNATIEAARAGEAGKGFAVVATEVKELAHQSAKATEGIRTRVAAMQASTAETVDAIASIEEAIEQVTGLIEGIDSSLRTQSEGVQSIAAVVNESTQASLAISTSIRETAQASEEVARSVQAVDRAVSDAASGAEQTNLAGRRVADHAVTLGALTSQFRYGE